MYLLGINAYHGDASATLLKDGIPVLAIEEERLNRKKHCAGFPTLAIQACLKEAGISISDVDHVAISTDPSANLGEKILYSLTRITKIHKMLRDRLSKVTKTRDLKTDLAAQLGVDKTLIKAQIHNVEHHLAHMASAFFSAPFKEGIVLTLDGMGDFVSSKWGYGKDGSFSADGQVEYPHSIGYLYTATTQFLGFPYYGDEGKVMGLAPYGEAKFLDEFRKIIITEPGKIGYKLNLDYFLHHSQGIEMQWDEGQPTIGRMYSDKFVETFGPAREYGSEYTQYYKDIAASLQRRTEEVCLDMIQKLSKKYNSKTICLAGGVALNSVMNGKIRLETDVREVYIHPNAGDGGTSLGAAKYVYHQLLKHEAKQPIEHAYLGLEYDNAYIKKALIEAGISDYEEVSDEELFEKTAQTISEGNVVGWFQGRMEWGPRALGSRSIVADPRNPNMKDILNARIKKRENFRPFAPSIIDSATGEYFEQDYPAPTMLMVYQVNENKREVLPAITHVDGSGRLQTVHKEHHPRYFGMIEAFGKLTGVPVVLNTSFNENEPVVCTPEDAIDCFLRTKMDALSIGNFIVRKK
ncbi:carbamoyltransferase [bacterium]|nr:MAG: carbamoyltransferase [bacterium]